MSEHLKKYIFFYTIVPLLILTVSSSYYRAMVSYDYLVEYEGECDPFSEVCYEYCEDDECTEPFYYSWMTRSAAVIKANCESTDITECDFAYSCMPEEVGCVISYCDMDLEPEECETLEEADRTDEIFNKENTL